MRSCFPQWPSGGQADEDWTQRRWKWPQHYWHLPNYTSLQIILKRFSEILSQWIDEVLSDALDLFLSRHKTPLPLFLFCAQCKSNAKCSITACLGGVLFLWVFLETSAVRDGSLCRCGSEHSRLDSWPIEKDSVIPIKFSAGKACGLHGGEEEAFSVLR